ncbi:iron uptake transporter deferrochelatase/peroxidase subunit [Dactylosporangium sp. NPDC048998]|uniref:iron uptake transporter deferrochelatase/peroxidase subunit n=1 Tax=Dactylosporangium sp. NPDC048998 TaxID=3363976 RepID=UPI00371E5ECB
MTHHWNVNRREAIKRLTAGAVGAAMVAGLSGAERQAPARTGAAADGPPAFYGPHQAGIFTPAQRSAVFAAFDVTAGSVGVLREALRALTARAAVLTTGGRPADGEPGAPPADSDVLGPEPPTDGLTITVSVGASLFDDRFGLAARRPARLATMPVFPNDALEPGRCHGDLMLQICADNPDTVHHALRDITRHTRGALQPRYRQSGFISPPRPSGVPRNLMGFKDGTANPTEADGAELVWVGPGQGEPDWAAGGTYQVVRLIRMLTEFWDRITLAEQEAIFGRRRDSGAPLDGVAETDIPDYERDPAGVLIPLDAHIRLANPRTAESAPSRILRRGYNYDGGLLPNGNLDAGLIFCCYQQDIPRQFEAVQRRLENDPLNDYVQPFGGGYFFALPGVRPGEDFFARALLQ